MNIFRFTRSIGVALAVAAGATAMPALAQAPLSGDALVAAAKKEGKVVFYNGTTINISRAVTKLFEQKYGIEVITVEGTVSAIRERVRTELASGRTIGDVRLSGVTTGAQEKAANFYVPHGDLANLAKLRSDLSKDDTLVPVTVSRYVLMVNTSLVKPQDEPKSWFDVLDPKWRGKIISPDPRSGGSGQVTYVVLYDKYGRDFLDKLALQKPVFGNDPRVIQKQVAQGEYPLMVPLTLAEFPSLEGLPVKPIEPKEGPAYVTTVLAALKNGPNPNAARLFMNFYLSDEAQEQVSAYGSESVTGVISDKLPAYMKPLMQKPFLGTADPFKLDEMVKLFEGVFGKK